MNSSGIPELDAIMRATSKKFGKDMSSEAYPDFEPLSTGSVGLDIALGLGGIPRWAVTEIFGWEGSGKSSLAFSCVAQAQKERREKGITNKRDLVIDLEHIHTPRFITGFGIDLDQIIWKRPSTAEEGLQMAIDYPKSGAIDMVMFDSVDAAQNVKQLGRSVGETDVGGISKDMNFALRQICKIAPEHETTYIFVNQIKQNPGQMMGNPNVTPGGNALKFYSALRLEMMKGKPSPNLAKALLMRIKLVKTKIAPPLDKGPFELDFLYGKGFHPIWDLVAAAKQKGVVRFAGPSCKVRWTIDGDEETLSTGGKSGLAKMLEDPDMFLKLKKACYVHSELEMPGDTTTTAAAAP